MIELNVLNNNAIPLDIADDALISLEIATPTGGGNINNQDKSVNPTESQQIVTADAGYTGLGEVTVGAISSSYVGSGIARRTVSDLSASGGIVSVPSGYYELPCAKGVPMVSMGTPTASKGAVSNHSIAVTPSVTNQEGYIDGGTVNGSAVYVNASELVSGTKEITANGTGIDVTNYAAVDVDVAVPLALVSITATYTQSSSVYDVDSLDSLKSNLVVTALYSDSSTETVPSTDYILSGTLTGGTSTITVTYGDKTDTFDVEVSAVVWLFKEGDECTTLTGGYEKKGFITNAYRLSYGNDGQELQFILRSTASTVTAGTLTTVNKISLSDYKSVCIDFDSERFDTSTAFRFYVSESVTDKTDYTAFGSPNDYALLQDSSVIGVPMGRQVKEFELSSTVTASSKYMSAMIRSYQSSPTGAYLRIYNIYLKPKDNISDADALSILLGETE